MEFSRSFLTCSSEYGYIIQNLYGAQKKPLRIICTGRCYDSFHCPPTNSVAIKSQLPIGAADRQK